MSFRPLVTLSALGWSERLRLVALGIVACMSLPLAAADAASFDCSKAATPEERAVCSSPRLSELDVVNAAAFNEAKQKTGLPELLPAARAFQADRRTCSSNISCLMASYIASVIFWRDRGATAMLPSWADANAVAAGDAPSTRSLPARIGQCVTTQIARVSTRLDFGRTPTSEDFNSGTSVDFTNQGRQVSYEREDELLKSRPGHSVIMCLILIPRGCPAGDLRGRVYTVSNLATRGSWTLPDSQHSCGGA